ncbi:MAG: CHRD domain-containing protein [Burkholderiaceae bacterium]
MIHTTRTTAVRIAIVAGALALAACSQMEMKKDMQEMKAMVTGEKLALSGANEVPAVNTSAAGTGTITVAADHSVSGSVTVTGISPTAGHIHTGAKGVNGPVIVPLTQNGNVFTVPAGAKLTDAQYDAYKAGNLYVNVHSAANPNGEIRAQLKGS